MKKGFIKIVLLISLVLVSIAFAYYYGTQQKKPVEISPSPTAQSQQTTPPILPTQTPISNIPGDWKTYTNDQYDFEISYPPTYKALTDKENLYGWPNGVVLIYDGGQSYDLAIERWDSQSEYENKYKNQPNITIKRVGNIYLTLLNTNSETEVDQIIQTFTLTP
jgi:regulatory protein YycH of two-component signal transduction system YycFG